MRLSWSSSQEPAEDENRKDAHLRLALEQQVPLGNDYDDVRFLHDPLAGGNRDAVDTSVSFLPDGDGGHLINWPVPLYVNGMTGGSERTGRVNRELAQVAAATGLPIGSGSLSAYFSDKKVVDSYRVLRTENPNGFVMANINAAMTVDQAKISVDLLEANALQIHLNPIQEAVMPEGDRDFSNWANRIAEIVTAVGVPVIVKEVGVGMSAQTISRLIDLGVQVVDVAGRGGTSFARIENARRSVANYGYLDVWGQSAMEGMLEAQEHLGQISVLASGGVRNPLDVVRALALGAEAVGVAGTFLRLLNEHGAEEMIDLVQTWKAQISDIIAVLGCGSVAELRRVPVLLGPGLSHFAHLRGVDVLQLARRGQ